MVTLPPLELRSGYASGFDQEMVDAPSANAFKGRPHKLIQTRVGFFS